MDNQKKSLFFAFEGIDGSGKSTQIKLLTQKLRELGMTCYETREPTDSPIGSLVHQIMTGRMSADGRVIATLFAADRLDHLLNDTDGLCREIDKGVTVVTDRYYFSNYAYNGIDLDMDWIIQSNQISAEILRPTLTIFLDIPVELALERIAQNRLHTELYEKEDRLRAVRAKYFEAFEKLRDTERVAVIDAHAPVEVVAQRVWDAVSQVL